MLGKLTLDAVPWHEPIIMGTGAVVALGGLAVLAALTYFRLWGPLWRDWITSVDHKKIGVMYIVLALVMLLRGFADAIMMRLQQAFAANDAAGFLPPHHYDQIFTAHGVIMIFFVATPLILGLMNVIVPLQIGARDVAFPFVNSLSFWLSAFGAVLVMASMWIGDFAATGWVAYPPLSELGYSPTTGVDYQALADAHFETDRYREFCAAALPHVDEMVLEWVDSEDFRDLLTQTIRSTYPQHEWERFEGHFGGLTRMWVADETARLAATT